MKSILIGFAAVAVALVAGCSAKAPITKTPDYHVGTPTNRSSVQSWELNKEPFYTQPGVNSGTQVAPIARTPSHRGFEPYDPLAQKTFSALLTGGVHVKYITATAKGDTVVLMGSANSVEQAQKALDIAEHVPGVKHVRNQLTVPQTVALQ